MNSNLPKLRVEYRRLQRHLAATGWISHGYVQDRGPGAGGPCYQWTRKERKKTVSVAGQTFKEGDFLSIDGTTGIVYGGQLKTAPSEIITGTVVPFRYVTIWKGLVVPTL